MTALIALSIVAGTPVPNPTQPFFDYLRAKDDSVAMQVEPERDREIRVNLTSQTWQGIPWKHVVQIIRPSKTEFKGIAMLHITGGTPNARETAEYKMVAEMTGMPIAALYGIPNQPLWNMWEDDLIAHTFEKYLSTGDSSWPLLFPMTKAAIRAMDATQLALKDTDTPIRRFVVTGASKRGWTTWFVGASGDRRVAAIAPLVIDNLNVNKQMEHQLATWGQYSLQIQDYTRRGLQQRVNTDPRGKLLSQMIDPYTYRDRIKVPTLIVNGANDPYWTVDALSLYWNDLKQPKWAAIIPNAGHGLDNGYMALESLAAFARSTAGEFRMPRQFWTLGERDRDGAITVTLGSTGVPVKEARVWMATSDTLDFRPSKWEVAATSSVTPLASSVRRIIRVPLPAGKNTAVMGEIRYRVGSREFSLNTPVKVYRR